MSRIVPVKEETRWRGYTIPPEVKAYVHKRDGYTCRYCGASGKGIPLDVDHVTPISAGGENVCWNTVSSCRACNRSKSWHLLECWETGLSCVYREDRPCNWELRSR